MEATSNEPKFEENPPEEELRKIFHSMPNEGIVIHGSSVGYSNKKKSDGLNYPSNHYFYIPKPTQDDLAKESFLVTGWQELRKHIADSAQYSLGMTNPDMQERYRKIVGDGGDLYEVTAKEFYKGRQDLYPSLMIFKGTSELANEHRESHDKWGIGVYTVRNHSIPGENFIFDVRLSVKELQEQWYEGDKGANALANKVLNRIEKGGWDRKSRYNEWKTLFSRKKEKKEVIKSGEEETLVEVLQSLASRQAPEIYMSALDQASSEGLFNIAVELKELVEKGILLESDLNKSTNPIGFYELYQRRNQILKLHNNNKHEEAKNKTKRILGVGEIPRYKREMISLKGLLVGVAIKLKYRSYVDGIVLYGSATNPHKPDSDEVDIKLIVNPKATNDTFYAYDIQPRLHNDLQRLCSRWLGKRADIHDLSLEDLLPVDDRDEEKIRRTRLLRDNNAIDANSIVYVFGKRTSQLFNDAFRTNLETVQSQFTRS